MTRIDNNEDWYAFDLSFKIPRIQQREAIEVMRVLHVYSLILQRTRCVPFAMRNNKPVRLQVSVVKPTKKGLALDRS